MYKAMEYPQDKVRTEHLYVSENVRRRFEGLSRELECVGLTVREAAMLSGVSYQNMRDYVTRKSYPSIVNYFKLAAFMGWDLSRDMNWHYMHVLHSPEEIQRRISRLFPNCKGLPACGKLLAVELGYPADVIVSTARYGKKRRPNVYGVLMQWIMSQEKARGLDDPLDLEQ